MSTRLAIIGYSGRYPSAQNNKELWNILKQGRDVVATVPKTRWNIDTHVDLSGVRKNTSAVPFGCWLEDPGLFDAGFFDMTTREAPHVDPAQRLALMTAYEALEYSGLVPNSTPSTQRDRIGVFYGSTGSDYGEVNGSQNIGPYSIPGACRVFISGRVSYYFKFSGPSYGIDNACASSLSCIQLACSALLQGDIDTAVVGATNLITNPDVTAGLDSGGFLSRTGNCKTFDEGADGYCRSEGAVTFIIKRYEDAVADNDPIISLILAASTNHSAQAESITRPHVATQRANIEKVLLRANVDPDSVGYVEMHGTGTQIGDTREMESVLTTFAHEARETPRMDPLYLGSVKPNIGHGEAVSGSVALAKVLMLLENDMIPPHIGIKTKINPKIPSHLEQRNVHIPTSCISWPRSTEKPRRVVVNNFSAAGNNSTILIEDAPLSTPRNQDPRSSHIITVSARSATALVANVKSLIQFIKTESPDIASLSYTTTARRMHHPFRVAVHGSSTSKICQQLKKGLASTGKTEATKDPPQVAFAFTGQGKDYHGMGRVLLQFQSFAHDMHRLDGLCQSFGFPSVLPYIQANSDHSTEASPVTAQLALTCLQIATARLWKSWGVTPSAVVGHSIGEFAALCVAGVLSDEDTVWIVGKRALLLQEKCTPNTHSMLAVHAALEDISMLELNGIAVEVACKNGPNQVVLSGAHQDMVTLRQVLSEAHVRSTTLEVPFAFHSAQMEPILEGLIDIARNVRFHKPRTPVISPVLRETITDAGVFSGAYLARHCRETVDFSGALSHATKNRFITQQTLWVEIGPHPVLSAVLRSNLGPVNTVPSLHCKADTWKVLTESLASVYTSGVDVDWVEYHRSFAECVSVLRLPSYNWDLENYWIPYRNDWCLHRDSPQIDPTKGVQSPQPKSEPHLTQNPPKISKKRERISRTDVEPVKRQRLDVPTFTSPTGPVKIGLHLDMATLIAVEMEKPEANTERDPEPDSSWLGALKIISDVTGVSLTTNDNVCFTDVGVDSLLSTTCAGRFETELGVPYDPTIFFKYPTIQELKSRWGTSKADSWCTTSRDHETTTPSSGLDGNSSSGEYATSKPSDTDEEGVNAECHLL